MPSEMRIALLDGDGHLPSTSPLLITGVLAFAAACNGKIKAHRPWETAFVWHDSSLSRANWYGCSSPGNLFRTSVVHEQSDAVEQAWTCAFLQRKASTEPQLLLVMLDSLLTELFRGGKSSANSTLCFVILELTRESVKQICGVLSLSSRANSRASPRAMITA